MGLARCTCRCGHSIYCVAKTIVMSSTESSKTKKVFLWCAPRCLSTVFERSIRELADVKVMHEPYQYAYYLGPERRSGEYTNIVLEPDATFEAAKKRITAQYDGYDAVFVKEMAYYIEGHYEDYITEPFTAFKHTFLIRNPLKTVTSLYKACESAILNDFSSMAGFRHIYELFQVVKRVDPSPIVIDADDLLDNPEAIMREYCSATGLPFSTSMLSWSPVAIPDWVSCPDYEVWHGSVIRSSGFIKPQMPKAVPNLSEYPKEIEEVVKDSLPFYKVMYDARLQLV